MKKELHVISTGKQSADELTAIASVIHPFIDALHLREKSMNASELFKLVNNLISGGVPRSKLYINDRVDVAAATGVNGVQLGYNSLDVSAVKETFPRLRVGSSVHSLKEALEKEQQGADFLVFGHIFNTTSKPDLQPRGIASLRELTDAVSIPVIAIGGINTTNIANVLQANVQGVAVLSAILEDKNPLIRAKELNRLLYGSEVGSCSFK
ncbi:thiazole tautomerase TenI [Bacillus sp. Marseille-P3661]|uniref:thiazole tautomerase TenI n=1 Tax=Bacillus sp. Marseille-P3661 TaxID=1936234 RepID=UPI000C84D2AE|nr:thiazole tautomerase TenI [Bacillus sp. Marseille-P3661]